MSFDVRRNRPQPAPFQRCVVVGVVPRTVFVASDMPSGDMLDSAIVKALQRGKVPLCDRPKVRSVKEHGLDNREVEPRH